MTTPLNLIASGLDDAVSAVKPIGFTFWFAGVAYTNFSVDVNGVMKLGDVAIVSQPANGLGSNTNPGNFPRIAPYWDDLATGTGSVTCETQGSPGSKVLVINWNVAVPKTNSALSLFQVQIYEATGNIYFAFASTFTTTTTGLSYSMGICASATDFASVTVTGSTSASVAYGVAKDNNTTRPYSGSVKRYQFGTDYTAPLINNNVALNIPNTAGTANRVLSNILVQDQAGVPVSGVPVPPSVINVPRIYFKKSTDNSYISSPGVYVSGPSTGNTYWDFTINHSLLGGVAAGDQISYFIVAQDQAEYKGGANIKSNPVGVVATDVNNVTVPPPNPPYYIVGGSYSGTVTVGSGGDFENLTNPGGLFDQINAGELTGNLTVNITSDLTAETGAKALNAWVNNGGTYTVTINPVGNRTVSGITVNGGNGGVITLNGATGVTIDGLNDGTNSLTFIQTGQYYVGSMIDIKGASNNTITRVTVQGYGASNAAISLTNSNTPSRPSSNNTVSYCNITTSVLIPNTWNAGNGISLVDWSGTTPTGNLNVIDHNTITNFVYNGILLTGKYTNTAISNNEIYNTVGTS
ncbi:MAG: hypothetical protein IPF54_08275 [Draconibacterium sp.]|nr:hypothetical protein [Draconibacterium sp.]